MTVIVEQGLVFKFGPSWKVEKYDEQPIHTKGIQCVQGHVRCKNCHHEVGVGTKAVDFVGVHNEQQPYLIEVKDFRKHRIENRDRLRNDLAIEVAFKVRDTLAGLVGALHAGEKATWQPLVGPMFHRTPKVLLWLEYDEGSGTLGDQGQRASTLAKQLELRLRWLSPHVNVTNRRLFRRAPDLEVTTLKDGIFELRKLMKKQMHISREDFCREWPATLQDAGMKLKMLCDAGFLRPLERKSDVFMAGTRWDHFHEEPT